MKELILALLVINLLYQSNYAIADVASLFETMEVKNQDDFKEKLQKDKEFDLKNYNIDDIFISAIRDNDQELIKLSNMEQ